MSIPIVGKCFATSAEFIDYLEGIKFGAWRPRFVTMHHTGAPDLKTWQGWQTRKDSVTDEAWLRNLADYYGREMGWSAGPHFFFTPQHFCVLSPPDRRGVHAVSFNAVSWAVECVGDFDRSPLEGALRAWYVEGLAALHIASGLQLSPFEKGVRGLHFHRDDPKTTKTCPGKTIVKSTLIAEVERKIIAMTQGDHPEERVVMRLPAATKRTGRVNTDDLNVRLAASAKAPVVRALPLGASVDILGEAKNGETLWFAVDGGFVAARYVDV